MAIYTYQCKACGGKGEVVQSIKSYCEKPDVPECCDTPMERYLTKTMVSFDTAPWGAYQSPIDGQVIDSRAKRNEHMAKHGVVMYDDIKPDVERNRKTIEEQVAVERRNDIIESVQQVQAGYVPPKLEVADQSTQEFVNTV